MSESPRSTNWSDVPIETVMPGVTRQTVNGDRQTVVRYVYAPGAVFPIHAHPEEQCTIVISGRIRFEVDGAPTDLGPGGILMIPANAPHGACVVGNESVESFNTLSPRRAASPTFAS